MNKLVGDVNSLCAMFMNSAPKWIGKDFSSIPFNWFRVDTGEESGCNTDLYQCTISNNNAEMRFAVEVDSENGKVVDNGIKDIDIIVKGRIYDGIDLTDENQMNKVLSRIEKL